MRFLLQDQRLRVSRCSPKCLTELLEEVPAHPRKHNQIQVDGERTNPPPTNNNMAILLRCRPDRSSGPVRKTLSLYALKPFTCVKQSRQREHQVPSNGTVQRPLEIWLENVVSHYIRMHFLQITILVHHLQLLNCLAVASRTTAWRRNKQQDITIIKGAIRVHRTSTGGNRSGH